MYSRIIFIGSLLVLTGCQTSEVLTQHTENQQVYTEADAISYYSMKLPDSKTIQINQQTQYLDNGLIDSPVAAFELPANRGKLEIKVTSQIGDSVFSPLIIMTDKQGNVLDHYDSDIFEYRRAKLIYGDRLVAEIDYYPPTALKTVNMLIYTNKEELAKQTFVVHPGRAMAEAKGNHLPELKDIPKPHAQAGELLVEVDGANIAYIEPKQTQQVEKKQNQVTVAQPETASFYTNAIKTAVKANDIPKALALLEEAKALNVAGAQEAFVNAVNQK